MHMVKMKLLPLPPLAPYHGFGVSQFRQQCLEEMKSPYRQPNMQCSADNCNLSAHIKKVLHDALPPVPLRIDDPKFAKPKPKIG